MNKFECKKAMAATFFWVPCSIPLVLIPLMIFSMLYLDSISHDWDLVFLFQEIVVRFIGERFPLFILGCSVISILPLACFLVDNIGTQQATEHLYVKHEGSIYIAGKRIPRLLEAIFYISLYLQGHDKDKSIDEMLALINDAKDLDTISITVNLDSRIKEIKRKDLPKKASELLKKWHEDDYDTRMLPCQFAFPLLYSLVKAGEQKASKFYLKEIKKRFNDGYYPVQQYLGQSGHFFELSEEEQSELYILMENPDRMFSQHTKLVLLDKNK